MNRGFGIAAHDAHHETSQRAAIRYLVLIKSGGEGLARLFTEDRTQLDEFDAGASEVAWLAAGQQPSQGAHEAVWDRALMGHSAEERAEALVYTLDV